MATQKDEDMRGGSRHCYLCSKKFTPDKEEEEAKILFSIDETSRFIDEKGFFSCEKRRRDQTCNDCFHIEVFGNNECLAFERDVKRALQQVWKDPHVKDLYMKVGIKIPTWIEDEVTDDGGPSENVERQTERASSSSLSGEKTCAHCGKVGDLDRCSNCKDVTFFCSRSHQAAGYAKYKVEALVNETADLPPAMPTDGMPTGNICPYCVSSTHMGK